MFGLGIFLRKTSNEDLYIFLSLFSPFFLLFSIFRLSPGFVESPLHLAMQVNIFASI